MAGGKKTTIKSAQYHCHKGWLEERGLAIMHLGVMHLSANGYIWTPMVIEQTQSKGQFTGDLRTSRRIQQSCSVKLV